MADRNISVRLSANVSDFLGALSGAAAAAASTAGKIGGSFKAANAAAVTGSRQASTALANLGQDQGEHLRTISRTLRNVGIVGVAGVAAAVKVSSDFDAQLSKVAMTGDDARANLTRLRDAALDAGVGTANIGYSATEAGEALEYLAKAGVSADDSISGGLAGSLQLAAAGGLAVGDAAETAATAMAQFELKGKDVPHIADLLAAGAGKAQGSVEQLGYALKYVGPVAHGMGVSIEETVGTLAGLAQSGILGEQAGTSLRGVLLSLTSPSKVAKAEMDKLKFSVYDASGKFVGLKGVATQLEQKLGKLSEAERNAALGRLFGNAQVTAARVIYKLGAAGIQEWTDKVNDANYAQDAARTRMDNLQGDLKKLKSSFQNALIGAGAGAQSPFRSLIKGATGAVDAINKVPASAQSAGVRIAGIVGILGLAGGAFTGTVAKVGDMREALEKVGATGPNVTKTGTALLGLGKAATIAAVALIALNVAGAIEDSFAAKAPALEDLNRQMVALGKGSAGAADSLNDLFRVTTATDITKNFLPPDMSKKANEVDGLAGALKRLYNPTSGNKISDALGGLLEKIGGGSSVVTQLKGRFVELDTSLNSLLAGGKTKEVQDAFGQISQRFHDLGYNNDQLLEQFPQLKKQFSDQATSLGVTTLSAQDYVDWIGGKVPAAIQAAIDKSPEGAKAAIELSDAYANVGTALANLVPQTARTLKQNDDLAKSLFGAGNAAQNATAGSVGYQAAVDAASKTLDKNGETLAKGKKRLDDHTEAGRENLTALLNLSTAGKGYVQSLVAAGKPQADIVAATQKVRDAFVKQAEDAGLTGKAAERLADSYGLIPDEVNTQINVFNDALNQSKVTDLVNALQGIPPEKRTEIYSIYEKDGAEAALTALHKIDGTTATARVLTKSDAKKVAEGASGFLARIKDGAPAIKTKSDARKVTSDAKSFLKSIKDVDPKVLTKKDLKAAEAAKAYLKAIKDKPVKVKASAVGVAAAQQAIDNIKGHTVEVITHVGRAGGDRATGGFITGPGTATSDSIPVNLSNGEYVIRAAAVRALGLAQLHQLNSLGGPQRSYATGGLAGAAPQRLAVGGVVSGNTFSAAELTRLLVSVEHPLAELASLTKDVAEAQKAATQATKDRLYAEAHNKGITQYQAAVKDKTHDLNENAAAVAKQQKEVDKAEAKYAKNHTKANKRTLDRERRELKSLRTRNAAEIAGDNKLIEKRKDAYEKAKDDLQRYTDDEKDATQAVADAQSALADRMREVADAARATSDTFREAYTTQSTDASDWIALMQQGAADITKFTGEIVLLRKAGLNETVIQQIVGMGATAGSAVAEQLIMGGAALVNSLNTAQSGIQDAADQLGLVAATPVAGPRGGGVSAAAAASATPPGTSGNPVATSPTITYSAPSKVEQSRLATTASYSPAATPLIDTVALANAVTKGISGMQLTGKIDGDAITLAIDQALTGFVGGFARAGA